RVRPLFVSATPRAVITQLLRRLPFFDTIRTIPRYGSRRGSSGRIGFPRALDRVARATDRARESVEGGVVADCGPLTGPLHCWRKTPRRPRGRGNPVAARSRGVSVFGVDRRRG